MRRRREEREREHERRPETGAPRGDRRERRQQRDGGRDQRGATPAAELGREPVDAVEDRRAVDGRGDREAAQRHADRDDDEPGGEREMGERERPAARGIEGEAEAEQRDDVEDVALLDLLAGDGRLAWSTPASRSERDGEERCDRAERELVAGAGVRERQPSPRSAPGTMIHPDA